MIQQLGGDAPVRIADAVASADRPVSRLRCVLNTLTAYDAVRVALGLLLLAAAGLKGYQLSTEPVQSDLGGFAIRGPADLLEHRWFLIAVVEFELFFGLWLFANLYPRLTRWFATACFAFFAAVSCYKALSGAASCGCFGQVHVNPWITFTIDIFAVALLLACRPKGSAVFDLPGIKGLFDAGRRPVPRAVCVLAGWGLLGLVSLSSMAGYAKNTLAEVGSITSNGIVVLEPEKWIGKRFPLLPYILPVSGALQGTEPPIREQLTEGKWQALLYRHDCPSCKTAVQELSRTIHKYGSCSRVALIEMPPHERPSPALALQCSGFVYVRLTAAQKWFVTTPVRITLDHGNVVSITY